MHLKEIRYVLAIASEGSITSAAQKLYLSQPSLSQFLNEYEEALGFPLFIRMARGVSLTSRGREYVATAKDVINNFDKMLERLTLREDRESSVVKIGIPEQRGMVVTPLFLPRFTLCYPNIHLNIIDAKFNELKDMVRDNELDIALAASLQNRNYKVDNVSYRTLLQEEIMIAIPKQHELISHVHIDDTTEQQWIDLKALCSQKFVVSNQGRMIRQFTDKFFEDNNIMPQILQSSTNISTVLKICLNLNAITFVAKGLTSCNKDMYYVSIGKRGKHWNLVLMTSGKRQLSPIENDIVAVLSACLEETCK
ncbi:LysR family transcriptional regulator [Synergistales bacterium]|nr:LysR family transcriptional regulator [Synergistales bacterium]